MVDAVIENQYQSQGNVKCPKCGVNGVDDVVVLDGALTVGWAEAAVAPPEQRGHGDEDGDGPDGEDHQRSPLGCPLPGIFDGVGDGPVPVQGNHTEMEDGAGAAGHVHTQPHLTDEVPKLPAVHDNVHDAQGHDEHCHQQVCHSQRTDQVVCRLVELLGRADGYDHGRVQQHGQGGDDHQSHADEHLLCDGLGSHSPAGFCGTVCDVHVSPLPVCTVEKQLVMFL